MKVGIICTGKDERKLKALLQHKNPELDIKTSSEICSFEEIESLILWKQPADILSKFKNLKLVSSFGAGVDHILSDPGFNPDVTLTRIIDPELNEGLFKYCLTAITFFEKRIDRVIKDNLKKMWDPGLGISRKIKIGILGMGEIGSYIAINLANLGYQVSGYSNNRKNIKGVISYTEAEKDQFLANINTLICTLPLTRQTQDILDIEVFERMEPRGLLINIGRGKQLVEEDLIEAINNNLLDLAFLDVFREEPLPVHHPFWDNSQIIVTPHIASLTSYEVVAKQFSENLIRFKNDESLIGMVNPRAEY